jgi:hypothetical protein
MTDDNHDSSMVSSTRSARLIAVAAALMTLMLVGLVEESSNNAVHDHFLSSRRGRGFGVRHHHRPSVHDLDEMEHRALSKKGRIVGGQESVKGQFPFMVSLRNGDKDWSWPTCGGSLISPSIVLTAAHCVGNVCKCHEWRKLFRTRHGIVIKNIRLSCKDFEQLTHAICVR